MQQKERARRDPPDDIVGVERVHGFHHLERKLHDRARREVATKTRRDGNDSVARHHHRLARALAALPLFHHRGELLPGPGGGVLPAEFLLAVAPAAGGNAGGHPAVDPRRGYGDRRAETLAPSPDAVPAR